ncbi:MAG: DUF3300 domain-containing protein [Bryobacteraceae bacterium]
MERYAVQQWFRRGVSLVCVLAMMGLGAVVLAQGPAAPPAPPPPAQAQAAALAPQQLDDLVAPIALYPDPLLGQVLAACTYPVELVEAEQWLQANSNLQGQQLMDAARQQNWDASVQALVAMPDVLAKLTENVQWTTDLGNAFLAQQADVMGAVQRMRERAQANGKLQSTQQETVTTQDQGGQSAIEIEPANPQVIYVPTYDPYYVWGPPAWGFYPPLYYPDYGYGFGPGIDIGLCFGGWGGWGFGGWGWGWGPNWFGGGLFINAGFFNHYGFHGYGFRNGFQGRTAWMHDPAHRLGVAYPNSRLNSRFGGASQASRMAAGRSGNWHTFGAGNAGNRNSFRGGTAQAGARSFGATRGSSGWQHFQGQQGYRGSAQSYRGSAQSYRGSAQGYRGSAQSYRGSAQSYRGSAQSYRGSAQSYRGSPQRSFGSAPRMSAPSYRGGGGFRSYGGGSRSSSGGGFHGGGGSRSSGGGGSHGGGGHGGRR